MIQPDEVLFTQNLEYYNYKYTMSQLNFVTKSYWSFILYIYFVNLLSMFLSIHLTMIEKKRSASKITSQLTLYWYTTNSLVVIINLETRMVMFLTSQTIILII